MKTKSAAKLSKPPRTTTLQIPKPGQPKAKSSAVAPPVAPKKKQGPWTRIRPLQPEEVDKYTAAAIKHAEWTWGRFPNNLVKTMAHCPSLTISEIPYANSFIFDVDVFNDGKQFAGFLDRPLKELIINRVSLLNRSRYSITHHTFIGCITFKGAGREEEGHRKFLNLHEHEKNPKLFTARERLCLDFTVNVARDAHDVTNAAFNAIKAEFSRYNRGLASASEMTPFDHAFIEKWAKYDDAKHAALVDQQMVELTWNVGHFCLLNRFFTVLQVPDEGPDDELDFQKLYAEVVPANIRARNAKILGNDF